MSCSEHLLEISKAIIITATERVYVRSKMKFNEYFKRHCGFMVINTPTASAEYIWLQN